MSLSNSDRVSVSGLVWDQHEERTKGTLRTVRQFLSSEMHLVGYRELATGHIGLLNDTDQQGVINQMNWVGQIVGNERGRPLSIYFVGLAAITKHLAPDELAMFGEGS